MQREIIEYHLFIDDYLSDLNCLINNRLSTGWNLYGEPIISMNENERIYGQAMVKYKETECQK